MGIRSGLVAGMCLLAIGCSEPAEVASPAPSEEEIRFAAEMATLADITGRDIRAQMVILADDAMAGREAGSVAYDQAAAHVARLFAETGLNPLGEAGTFFQNIEFFETRLIPDSASTSLHAAGVTTELIFAEDFVRSGGYGEAVLVSLPL